MIKRIFFLGLTLQAIFAEEAFEGSGLVEGSGDAPKRQENVEGSAELDLISSFSEVPLLTEGSGDFPTNSVVEPNEALSEQEIEILKGIKLEELATETPTTTLESIDEEPLSQNIIGKMEDKIENDVKPGYSWKRLEELLSDVISTELSKEIKEIEATTATPQPKEPKQPKPFKQANVCGKLSECRKDSDCGNRGKCMGALVGKCNCNACLQRRSCSDDTDCGGLQGGCRDGQCACAQVFAENGLHLYVDVLTRFCNVKSCETSEDCLGLPCNPGKCDCL